MKCETIDLEVPADVDFVLVGYVQPGETRPEGPFGDHTGILHAGGRLPVFHPHRDHPPAEAVYPSPSWAFRPWRISTWARRASAIFLPSSR